MLYDLIKSNLNSHFGFDVRIIQWYFHQILPKMETTNFRLIIIIEYSLKWFYNSIWDRETCIQCVTVGRGKSQAIPLNVEWICGRIKQKKSSKCESTSVPVPTPTPLRRRKRKIDETRKACWRWHAPFDSCWRIDENDLCSNRIIYLNVDRTVHA